VVVTIHGLTNESEEQTSNGKVFCFAAPLMHSRRSYWRRHKDVTACAVATCSRTGILPVSEMNE
jgi:hypothetical protein